MNAVVVDTDVVSFLFKRDSRAIMYLPHLAGKQRVVSFMTVAELDFWAMKFNWGPGRKAQLAHHLQRFVHYPYDRDLCFAWAEVTHQAHRAGRPIQCADAWVAATALSLGIPLITHNATDFVGLAGLSIITEGP
jgi:predicted nucleic acid-binding protein